MAVATVNWKLTPDEARTAVEHLTDARSRQDKISRSPEEPPGVRVAAKKEFDKLTKLLDGL